MKVPAPHHFGAVSSSSRGVIQPAPLPAPALTRMAWHTKVPQMKTTSVRALRNHHAGPTHLAENEGLPVPL